MRTTTVAVSILIILISSAPIFGTITGRSGKNYATVFIYHKFDEPRSPSTSISSVTLRKHLEFLKENNYSVISTEELLSLMRNGSSIPPRTVVITIDDGYRSTYSIAYPILKEYGYPFTVFLYMEGVARYPDYLTGKELEEMKRDPLVTFGNHSFSHHRLARQRSGITDKEYLRILKDDLLRSEKRFSELIGHRPYIFSYPYGEYSLKMIELLRAGNYIGAFTQDTGNVDHRTNLLLIPRNPLVGGWAEMNKFREFLGTEPLHVKKTIPGPGILPSPTIERIEAVVEKLQSYRNPGIYISELGWQRPVVQASTGKLILEGPFTPTRAVNRIGITGVNTLTGRKATFFFMILRP